ncbi:MAG TPA: translocation/assembly module TamB domain-containing protein [Nodosilinea sp.]|nr:translocation/assembly module TamB domain-containing protein [Nodosilinea sp.]
MTSPQEPESDQPEESGEAGQPEAGLRVRSRRWLAVGLLLGSGLLAVGGAAAIGGWLWSRDNLMPWLSTQLSDVLDRPVELGPLERLGPTGLRVGPSTLPPTATDPDTLSVEAIEIRFNPLDLLRREVRLAIHLEGIDAYLEQTADGEWIAIDLDLPEDDPDRDPFIEVQVGMVRLSDGQLTMRPYGTGASDRPEIALVDVQGRGDVSEVELEVEPEGLAIDRRPAQRIDLTLQGTSVKGGDLTLKGAIQLPTPADPGPETEPETETGSPAMPGFLAWIPPQLLQSLVLPAPPAWAAGLDSTDGGFQGQLNLRASAVEATDIMPMVESFLRGGPLPVQFPTGLVSGSIDMALGGEDSPAFTGTARVSEATVTGATLPEPLENLQGDVRFRGRTFEFESVTASMGELTARAGGSLDFDEGYNLSGQINPFTAAQAAELLETTLPVETSGTFVAEVTMTGALGKPVIATELVSQESITIDQVAFAEVRARGTLRAPNLVIEEVLAVPEAGGSLRGNGQFTFGRPGQLSLALTGDRVPADALAQAYGLSSQVTLGPVFFEATVAGPVNQLTGNASWRAPAGDYPARGDLRLEGRTLRFTDTFVQVGGGTVAGQGTLANGQWTADLRAQQVQLRQLGAGVDGVATGSAQLAGSLQAPILAGMRGQGQGAIALAGGTVLTQANLAQGQWTANVQGSDLQLQAFAPDLQGTAGGQFRFTGSTDNLTLAGVRGQGQVQLSDGLATAAGRAPQLAEVRSPLTADLAWNGQSILVQQASTAGVSANGFVTPLLSGPGSPAIANLDLNLNANGFNLAALPIPQVIPLQGNAFFQGRLRGRPGALALNGEASLVGLTAGDLAFASPLSGPVTYAQGGPLAIDLTGGSDRVYVATQGAQSQGRNLVFEVRGGQALAQGSIQGDNLYATVANLPLSDLRLPQSEVNGIGTVGGLITSAEIVANLSQPTLRATFNVQDPTIGYLSLPSETVASSPDDPTPPEEITRYGQLQGTVTYANNVVSLVGGVLESASGLSRYLASGTYTLGDRPQLNGELVVDNGQIQEILQTLLIFERADFRLSLLRPPEWFRPATEADIASLDSVNPVGDRTASLLDQLRRLAEIQELQDRLAAEAEAAPLPPLEEFVGSFSGRVTANGTVPQGLDVTFNLAGADWVWGDPDGTNGSVYRIDEVIAQGRYEDSVLQLNPVSLRSNFADFSDTTEQGVALATLNGEFSFDPDDDVARTLRLEVSDVPINAVRQPLRLPSNLDGLMNLGATLTGSLSDPQVRGRLSINEATINRNTIDLAAANFSYQEARLNLLSRVAIREQVDPLLLVASVPLTLPGVTQRPSSDEVNIDLRMRDEGFALVNLFTQAIAWESGTANLNLAVQGRWPINKSVQEALTSLNVTGAANFEGVTISARSLPEPLTNIQGSIQVVEGSASGLASSVYANGLALDFQNLRGDFSEGEVVAQGKLTLLPSVQDLAPGLFNDSSALAPDDAPGAAPPDDRFNLRLDTIALDLRSPAGTYRGQVDGNVMVDGSVFLLPPLVYGEVRLSNGLLTLPDANAGGATASFASSQEPSIFQPIPPVLEDFQLTLADNVRLAIPGIVDVRAEGSLDLVGAAPNIKPNGRINLPSGRINLLTTEFRLTGNENYAEFSDLDETIDPYLVADLSAAVPDSAAAGNALAVATPFQRNEISVSRIDQLGLTQAGVQTVRIRASVNGRASRVVNLQGVELSSTPPRSEGEIVALISGGFLAALESTLGSVSGGGDGFQGLLAFAGSALLNNLQNLLGAGLERTDLRLFSASPPGGQQGGAIDIGGEVGFNFSPNISVSVQKVFTNVTPAVFSVRYRVTDQITLRGTTSYEQFNENTGAVLEFRF